MKHLALTVVGLMIALLLPVAPAVADEPGPPTDPCAAEVAGWQSIAQERTAREAQTWSLYVGVVTLNERLSTKVIAQGEEIAMLRPANARLAKRVHLLERLRDDHKTTIARLRAQLAAARR